VIQAFVIPIVSTIVGGAVMLLLLTRLLGVRYIPHNKVGVVEKLWSLRGSLASGHLIALSGEAGFQASILRGGLHFFFVPWQYRIHKVPLVVVSEGRIGYVYARDGQPLPATQTLAHSVDCNFFQDAGAFLREGGQRGRQRAFLREGVFAINLAAFVVITEDVVLSGPVQDADRDKFTQWHRQLQSIHGFSPVVIGHGGLAPEEEELDETATSAATRLSATDSIGVVTVHDGPPIESSAIIAPEIRPRAGTPDHNYFQDNEAFLAGGGRRGKQLQVLTDGTFFINRWFATVEVCPKTLIPIGYVGVVVSYYGGEGHDLTGDGFRYGEQVETGERGVWKRALPPGKFPLNPYAMRVELVPTVNFVLRWITGLTEAHQYDKDLTSIDIITADGYEPVLPLSLVLHIDYEKAPSVVQRFGDVSRLISQTLDPILSAYFRDVAQSSHMLDLLAKREEIQRRATEALGRRFRDYDINCVAVLIGRPESKRMVGGEDPIDRLFDTYAKQEEAALQLRELNNAQAAATKQTELTQTRVDVEIAGNRGDAQLAEARRLARRDVARALGESRSKELLGRGEASRVVQVGLSEAQVLLQKVRAYGDPRLFAVNAVSTNFAGSAQPIVPERLFVMGGDGSGNGGGVAGPTNIVSQLLALLLAEKAGFSPDEMARTAQELERLAREATAATADGSSPKAADDFDRAIDAELDPPPAAK